MQMKSCLAALSVTCFFFTSAVAWAQDDLAPGELDPELFTMEALLADVPEDRFSIDPAFAGDYGLVGEMETASGIRLKPDGRFEFFYMVGMLDVLAEGTWSALDDMVIRLVADKHGLAEKPFEMGQRTTWDTASPEAQKVGSNTALLPCSYDGGPEDRGAAVPLEESVVFQIGYSIKSLPPLRSGKVRTRPYPLHKCSDVVMIGADGNRYNYVSNEGGYVLARMPDGSIPDRIEIENIAFAGKGLRKMEVDVPDLEPGLYTLLMDYRRFEPRMFDILYLEKSEKGFAAHFDDQISGMTYVRSEAAE